MTGLLKLRGVSGAVAVNGGFRDGGVNDGNVVGVSSGFFYSRRVGHVTLVTPGIVLGVVHSCRIIRGGAIALPSRLMKLMGYGGPGYVAGGRPVPAHFSMVSGRGNAVEYRCYRHGVGGRSVVIGWLAVSGKRSAVVYHDLLVTRYRLSVIVGRS